MAVSLKTSPYEKCPSFQKDVFEENEFANEFKWYFVTKIVRTVKGQNNTLLTCSWRFLRYNRLEQLEFKLKKNIWI